MDRFSPEQCPLPAVAAVAAAPVVVDILCIIVLSQISAFIMQNNEAFPPLSSGVSITYLSEILSFR